MTKMGIRAITLLRRANRKDDTFPAIWAFVRRASGGKFLALHQVVAADRDELTAAILERVVEALDGGNLPLLETDLGVPAPGLVQPTTGEST